MRNRILLSAEAVDLGPGAAGPVVNELHAYLTHFGWLRLRDQERVVVAHETLPEAQPGHFGDATKAALVFNWL